MTRVDLGRDTSGRPLVVDDTWLAKVRWAERRLGIKLTIIQGSYRARDRLPRSGTTHDEGGAGDLRTWDIPKSVGVWQVLTELRKAGLICWARHAFQGFPDNEIHALDYGNPNLSPAAASQVVAWEHGLNGLSGTHRGKDDGPRVSIPKAVPATVPVHESETAAKTSYVIDAHHVKWEEGLRPHMLLEQGYSALIAKATQGTHFVDPHFADFLRESEACGLPIAAYHFLERGNPVAQADHFMAVVDDPSIPLGTDAEMGGHPTWADVRAFEQRCKQQGRELRYLPRSYWASIGAPALTDGPALWNAAYPTNDRGYASRLYRGNADDHWDGYGGADITLWQFTSHGKVDGYPGNTDVSGFRGSPAELLALGLFKTWPNTPITTDTTKDWFTMATEDDLKAALHEVLPDVLANAQLIDTKDLGLGGADGKSSLPYAIKKTLEQGRGIRAGVDDLKDLLEQAVASGKSAGA